MRAKVCVLDCRHPVLAQHILLGAVEEEQEDGERPVRDGRAVQRRPAPPVHPLDDGRNTFFEGQQTNKINMAADSNLQGRE